MKHKGKHGGARPNSGPKPDIFRHLIIFNAAVVLGVGVDRARHMLAECGGRPELLLSPKRVHKLRKIAAQKDAHEYLEAVRLHYLEIRRKWGFRT